MISAIVLLGNHGEVLGRRSFFESANFVIPSDDEERSAWIKTHQTLMSNFVKDSKAAANQLQQLSGGDETSRPFAHIPIGFEGKIHGYRKDQLIYCFLGGSSTSSMVLREITNDMSVALNALKETSPKATLVWLVTLLLELTFTASGRPSIGLCSEVVKSLMPNSTIGTTVSSFMATLTDKSTAEAVVDSIVPELNIKPYDLLGRGSGSGPGGGGLLNSGSNIWWRRNKVDYSHDKLLLDFQEYLHAVIDRQDRVLSSHVTGDLEAVSELSGLPECRLGLEGSDNLDTIGYGHMCLKTDTLFLYDPVADASAVHKTSTVVSFTPPDGKSTILTFSTNLHKRQQMRRPPLTFKCDWTFTEAKCRVDLAATPTNTTQFCCKLPNKSSKKWVLKEVVFKMPILLPSTHSLFVSVGRAEYDGKNGMLIWHMGSLNEEDFGSVTLELTFDWSKNDSDDVTRKRLSVSRLRGHLWFKCYLWNLSGCRIAALEIAKTSKNFFKGCRHTVTGCGVEYQF